MSEIDEKEPLIAEETELEKMTVAHKRPHNISRPLTDKEEASLASRKQMTGDKHVRVSKKYDGRAARKHRPVLQNVLHNFYIEVDLPEFKRALDFSKDPKYQMLLVAINNPNMLGLTFEELCRRCNLGITDIATIWRNYQLSRGMMKMMNHMPQVMEDVAIDSKTRTVTCPQCNGEGKIVKVHKHGTKSREVKESGIDVVCPKCYGDGTIRVLGDKESKKLAFEAAGLLQSAQVNVQTNVNLGGGLPSLEDELKSVERVFDVQAVNIEEGANGNGSVQDAPKVEEARQTSEGGRTAAEPMARPEEDDFNAPYTIPDPTDYH
jgi:hypothetical protein